VPNHDGAHSNKKFDRVYKTSTTDNAKFVHVIFDESSSFDILEVDLSIGTVSIPENYRDSQNGPYKKKWDESMLKEITDLVKHDTWVKVSRSTLGARKPTKSRWVYTIKYNRDGTIDRFKSRFVVCGYSQIEGKDFTKAFSATLRSASFRCLLAIASGRKLQLEHFDVTNAFTQAELDDVDIWVEPPKGFDTERDKHGTFVLKLKKALYGTKQASRLWQQTLSEFLVSIGFVRSTSDPCLFLHESKEHGVLIVGVYVDDIILAHDGKGFDWFKLEFTKRFRSKHIGIYIGFLVLPLISLKIMSSAYVRKDIFSTWLANTFQITRLMLSYVTTQKEIYFLRYVSRKPLMNALWLLIYRI
jgi:hypothetical protein